MSETDDTSHGSDTPDQAVRLHFDELDELTDHDAAAFTSALTTDAAMSDDASMVSATVTATARPMGIGDMSALVTEITVVVGQLGLIAYVVACVRDRFRRGIVVDATGKTLEVRPDRRLPQGAVVVVADEGRTVTLDRGADLASALTGLIPGKK